MFSLNFISYVFVKDLKSCWDELNLEVSLKIVVYASVTWEPIVSFILDCSRAFAHSLCIEFF